MMTFTDDDLTAAYRRLRRAIHRLQEAQRDEPLTTPAAAARHLDRVEAAHESYVRCFNRYDSIARAIAKMPLSERL